MKLFAAILFAILLFAGVTLMYHYASLGMRIPRHITAITFGSLASLFVLGYQAMRRLSP